jgi:Phage integrase family
MLRETNLDLPGSGWAGSSWRGPLPRLAIHGPIRGTPRPWAGPSRTRRDAVTSTAQPPPTGWPGAAAGTARTPSPPTGPPAARQARITPRPPRQTDTDGHIGRGWFRTNIWLKALAEAGLGFHVTPHGLRHAHASWLLAGGADLQVVKERLGHASITTTEKYLHTLPDADDSAPRWPTNWATCWAPTSTTSNRPHQENEARQRSARTLSPATSCSPWTPSAPGWGTRPGPP